MKFLLSSLAKGTRRKFLMEENWQQEGGGQDQPMDTWWGRESFIFILGEKDIAFQNQLFSGQVFFPDSCLLKGFGFQGSLQMIGLQSQGGKQFCPFMPLVS